MYAYLDVLCAGVPLQEVQEWCVRHGFELVELEPSELPDEEGMMQVNLRLIKEVM